MTETGIVKKGLKDMRETLTSKVLRLGREMRGAITSYGVALTLFPFTRNAS